MEGKPWQGFPCTCWRVLDHWLPACENWRGGFAADERGVVAVIFAITFCAVFLTVAVAIDYARTATEYLRVQNAVDSAALAASHRLGLPDQDTQGPADANAYFKANTAKHRHVGVLDSVVLDGEKGEVQAKANGNMLTSLLKAVGIKQIGFNNQATVKKGKGTVEVALVLDNSGSMGGQPIADLRTAAQNLVSVALHRLRGHRQGQGGRRAVRGRGQCGRRIQDRGLDGHCGRLAGRTSRTSPSRRRASSFSRRWASPGAAASRCGRPRTTSPTACRRPARRPACSCRCSTRTSPTGQFRRRLLRQQLSAGLRRQLPRAPAHVPAHNQRGSCTQWSEPPPLPPAEAQARTCKYEGASIGSAQGPNYLCDSKPILPLTTDKLRGDHDPGPDRPRAAPTSWKA